MSQTTVDGVQVQNLGKRAGPVDSSHGSRIGGASYLISLLAAPHVLFFIFSFFVADDPEVGLMVAVYFNLEPIATSTGTNYS